MNFCLVFTFIQKRRESLKMSKTKALPSSIISVSDIKSAHLHKTNPDQFNNFDLSNPRIYPLLTSVEAITEFMKFHIFAVWDFMSVVKTMQVIYS